MEPVFEAHDQNHRENSIGNIGGAALCQCQEWELSFCNSRKPSDSLCLGRQAVMTIF